jgi:hypothetical protein
MVSSGKGGGEEVRGSIKISRKAAKTPDGRTNTITAAKIAKHAKK